MGVKLSFETASIDDAENICALINEAYRGDKGWTRETDIVTGERSSIDDIKALILNPESHLFVAATNGAVAACVCVEEKDNQAHIGTFAVSPAFQNQGIGKQVLSFAELYATKQLGSTKIMMVVISQRDELISFYERLGYRRTGEISEYPIHLNVGTPAVEGLTIEYLEKST